MKNIHFSGITMEHDLEILPRLQSRNAGPIEVKEIRSGVTVSNLAGRVSISPSPLGTLPLVQLSDLSAQCFDGTMILPKMTYDLNQPNTSATLDLEGLDLANIITTMRVKGLDVTGKVAGSLPLRLDAKGLSVDGNLHHLGSGGVIRYQPPADSGRHDAYLTELVLKALEEFHYSDLGASVHYQSDGTLLIALQLKGKSPRLDTDRPVHLNINTEQNLLSLLESLRYSKTVTEDLERNIQSAAE